MKTKGSKLGKLDKILAKYKGQENASISMLNEVQAEFAWIPPQAIEAIADTLRLFPSQVYSVATFCPFLSTKPPSSDLARRL